MGATHFGGNPQAASAKCERVVRLDEMRREPARRRVASGPPTAGSPRNRFPWELALGAFAAASILLSVVLAAAGSGAPSLVLAALGVGLTTVAAIVAWRANGITRAAGLTSTKTSDVPEAFERATTRSQPTGRMVTSRTGDDGADFDLSAIPDFRTRREPRPTPVEDGVPTPIASEVALPARPVPVPDGAEASVRAFVDAAGAVAGAVLMRRGRRLIAVAVAGNWGAARDARAGTFGTGAAVLPDAPVGAPEFPIDDTLADTLASAARAMPIERWEELTDVPSGMLPLLALGEQGVALVVATSHRRKLLALWVASAREGSRRYTDRDIAAFEAVARERASVLVPALLDG